jgi:hypothetical protein
MWEYKKHHQALSSIEAEFMALSEIAKEAIFIQSFVDKMHGAN